MTLLVQPARRIEVNVVGYMKTIGYAGYINVKLTEEKGYFELKEQNKRFYDVAMAISFEYYTQVRDPKTLSNMNPVVSCKSVFDDYSKISENTFPKKYL